MNINENELERGDAGIAADLAAEVIGDLRKLGGGALAKDSSSMVFRAIGKLVEIEQALRRIERCGGDGPFSGPAWPKTAACHLADGCGANSSGNFQNTIH